MKSPNSDILASFRSLGVTNQVIQGLEDYIIIDNKNTLLICKKEDEQQIKQFVSDIKRDKGNEYV